MEEEKKETRNKCSVCPFVISLLLCSLIIIVVMICNFVYINGRVERELEDQMAQMAQYGEEYLESFNESDFKSDSFASAAAYFIYPLLGPLVLSLGFAKVGAGLDSSNCCKK